LSRHDYVKWNPFLSKSYDPLTHLYSINYNQIVISVVTNNNSENFILEISAFLQQYFETNKHIINKIIITGDDYKKHVLINTITTLGKLTNYKELHINDSQLENHCITNNIKFVKI
jgi:hypothetical protein